MQPLIDFGISLIIVLQRMDEWVYPVMDFFSQLGAQDFFFLVLPMVYWSIDAALGLRIAFILVTSVFFNTIGKVAFAGPRPYWVSSHVRALWAETGFGAPSGHAQNALSIWGTVAAFYKKSRLTAVCIFLILMISFSRLVLGAHFPHDVLAGWLIGGALLWAFARYWDDAARWLAEKTFAQHASLAFLVSLAVIAVGAGVYTLRSDFQIPEEWMKNALRSGEAPDPVNLNDVFTPAGLIFGLPLGAAWIHSRGGYQAQGPGWKRALRYIVGVIVTFILLEGLGAIFPRNDDLISYVLRYIRYAVVGWWLLGGAPWVFKHFNLTTS